MFTFIEILAIIIIHWIADFIFQTDKMAKEKSKNWKDLLYHTSTYSLIWLFAGVFYTLTSNLPTHLAVLFALITFICHTPTDYFTSRLNSKLWAEGKTHWFFVSIGFDQILHYAQLFGTYYLLKTI